MLTNPQALGITTWNAEFTPMREYPDCDFPCTQPLQPQTGFQIYTDGSQLKNRDGTTSLGAGMHNATTGQNVRINPGGLDSTYTNNRAELVAIMVALATHPDDADLTIYTDSLGSLQNIRKQIDHPSRLRECKHQKLLEDIVARLGARAMGGSQTHLYKVRSHTGIKGNDAADRLAKEAALHPSTTQHHITVGENGYQHLRWPQVNKAGTDTQQAAANLTNGVKHHLPPHTLRGPTRKAGVYTTLWDAQLPTLQGDQSSKFWQDSTLTWQQKINLLRARWGHLWNRKLAYRYRRPYTGETRPACNDKCPLCHSAQDGASHILAGCQLSDMKGAYIKRHDLAVKLIQKSISKGSMGGCYTIMDAGQEQELPESVQGKRLPFTLKPPTVALDTWCKMRPDLLMIPQLRANDMPDATDKYRIYLVEIGYCSDTNHTVKVTAKKQQHEQLATALRDNGHRVTILTVTLGTTGTLHRDLIATMAELGVERAERDKVMTKLHKNATQCASNIIAMRRHREWSGATG
jgi:ribonuclease HI